MYKPELSNNKNKKVIRDDILSSLITLDKQYNRILTLPCLNFDIEKKALLLEYKVNT